jgi:transposase
MTANRPRSQDWKELRRRRALALKHDGWKQQAIAEALGVTKGAVSQWLSAARERGDSALRGHPHTGALTKLTEQQRSQIPELLSHGAEAYGFRGQLWTCARVARVITEEFGVSYHRAHVSRLLRALEWTPQKPIERASQRDEARILEWREETWGELKKRRGVSAERCVLLTKRAFTCCPASFAPMPRVVRPPC